MKTTQIPMPANPGVDSSLRAIDTPMVARADIGSTGPTDLGDRTGKEAVHMKWLFVIPLFCAGVLHAQSLAVTPSGNPSVTVGATRQFTATATGFTIAALKWEVASVQGGSAATGTITTGLTGGLYTAPAAVPSQNQQTILAVATDTNGNKYSASGNVTITPPPPVLMSVSPNPLPPGTVTVTVTATGLAPYASIWDGGVSYTSQQTGTNTLTTSVYTPASATSATFTVHSGGMVSNAITVPAGVAPATYALTVMNGTGSGSYAAGTVVNIAANPPPSGQQFQSWSGATVANASASTTTLTMPAANTTVTAGYTGAAQYMLTVTGGSGGGSYAAGAVVSIMATVPSGQQFTGWTGATVANPGSASTTLTMPAANTTVAAQFAASPTAPVISSVSPNPVPAGTVTVTLTGTGFAAGALAYDSYGANSMIQYAPVSITPTAVTIAIYQGSAATTTFQVRNPGSSGWSNALTVPVNSGPPPPQSIAPATVNVNLGATQQFASSGATAFTASAGSITSAGLYAAPATMPASNSVTVTATGPGGNASATVTLINPNPQLISPGSVTLALGATQQFTSAGATSWSAIAGTITPGGLYTAPSVWPASGADMVTVTGPNGTTIAAVTVTPPTPVVAAVGTNNQLPLGIFGATVTGTGLIAQSTVTLGGTPVNAVYSNGAINIGGFYGQSGTANLIVTNGSISSQPFSVQVGVPNPVVSASAARRFLQQAAFGPTPADAAHVQAIGFQAWLAEQFAMPVVSNYNAATGGVGMSAVFLTNAVTNPDQLRQKVAFALSQIFVTSFTKVLFESVMIPYQQLLLADAFTGYPQILNDVTLSPCMGYYLDMANNEKANPALGTVANENYAREIMQLMSIGTKVLNPDGTWPVDSSNLPIPTYQQSDVTAMARIFTGWTFAASTPGAAPIFGAYINPNAPMVPFANQHDTSAKAVMGYNAPAGLSITDDLNGVLAYLVNHPNTAPFISTKLIQHLVKSNPSPQYVQRVSTAFTQSNGDMPTVITAILLDPEARANDEGGADQPADGHLQEPALLVAGVVRAFAGQMNTMNFYPQTLASMGQDVFNAPSVFNYYSPGFVVGGTGGLLGPEFQIDNPNAAVLRENFVANLTNSYSNPVLTNGPGTSVDVTPFLPLASNPANLVNAIDLTLTEGAMPQGLKTIIVTAVADDADGPLHQVETAIYLTLISSYYNVWH